MDEEKFIKSVEELMAIQSKSISNDDYMAGMYNGMVCVFNVLQDLLGKPQKEYCSYNKEEKKWELV